MSTDYIVKRGRTPENLTIGSREPVQTGSGTAPRVGTSLCTSVRRNTHWTIRTPICHPVPSESRRTHAPSPAPRSRPGPVPSLHGPSLYHFCPSWPLCLLWGHKHPCLHQPGLPPPLPAPGPRAPGCCSPQQELQPRLRIRSHTSSCLDKATGCQGPGVNEFTALHSLARPRSPGQPWGAGGPRSDLAQRSPGPGATRQTEHPPAVSVRERGMACGLPAPESHPSSWR